METSFVRRWFVAVALVAFAAVATLQLAFELSVEPWLKLAIRMETTAEPLTMPEATRTSLVERIADRETQICGDLARSRVTVALDLLKREAAAEPVSAEAVRASTLAATKIVRDALYCSPSDANLWFVLANLEGELGATWRDIQRLLVMSVVRAPREGKLLLRRGLLLSWLLSKHAEPLDPRLKADLQLALATLDLRSIQPVFEQLRNDNRPDLVTELIARLPEERRGALTGEGTPKRPSLGRSERYRTFDFNPFGTPAPPPPTP